MKSGEREGCHETVSSF